MSGIKKHIHNKKSIGLSKPKGISSVEKKERKPVRYKNITHALRKIRRAQRSTEACTRKAPIIYLVKDIATKYDDQTWFRPSTTRDIQEAVEAQMIVVLQQAHDRSIEARTENELKKQTAVQVMEKNIKGAFKVWSSSRNGDFMELYDETLKNEWEAHLEKEKIKVDKAKRKNNKNKASK